MKSLKWCNHRRFWQRHNARKFSDRVVGHQTLAYRSEADAVRKSVGQPTRREAFHAAVPDTQPIDQQENANEEFNIF
jgi:hypothetical protein